MRWLPLILLFLLTYIELNLFVNVAASLGTMSALLLVILTSCVGFSLVRNQGMKNLWQMQQKLAAGENPAKEMIKSFSLFAAGVLLIVPGFFTDFLGLLLLLPPVQALLALKIMPRVQVFRSSHFGGASERQAKQGSETIEGEYQRKDDE